MRKTKLTYSLIFAGFFLASGVAQATSYTVSVNTQSISGTTGSLDFQFNPGVGVFQGATVSIANVSGGSYAGSQTIYGSGVTGGPIPSAITIANVAGQDNEVLDSYRFGSSLAFTLNFTGPAITSPTGANTAGSAFAFSIFSDAAGTIPVLTPDPNGIALEINLGTQGTLTPVVLSPNLTLAPEPSTFGALAFVALVLLARKGKRRAHGEGADLAA